MLIVQEQTLKLNKIECEDKMRIYNLYLDGRPAREKKPDMFQDFFQLLQILFSALYVYLLSNKKKIGI